MEENTQNGVNNSESPAERGETPAPGSEGNEHVEVRQGGEENRIPISRAEEMWNKRAEKMRSEWMEKELNPLKQKYEDHLAKLTKGQLGFMKEMGWYQPEPEKPLTRKELDDLLAQQKKEFDQQLRTQAIEAHIRSGWEHVSAKYPKLANNKGFQDAALARFASNPNVPLQAHAEALVKELLDPYAAEKGVASQEEREARRSPDRRVVPSGRGAAGGSGDKSEKKLSVGQKILNKLREKE